MTNQVITFSSMKLFVKFVKVAALTGLAYTAEETPEGDVTVKVTGA